MRPDSNRRYLSWALLAAACLPSLLAYNVSPSPTFLNQALAFAAWGLVVWVEAMYADTTASRLRDLVGGTWPVLLVLGIVLVLALGSSVWGALPPSLSLSAAGTLLAAVVVLLSGASVARTGGPVAHTIFAAFCMAWVIAGALNAGIGLIQVFLPSWCDGDWIARSAIPGRAVGNLRQPNHLSSLLLWSCICVVGGWEVRRLARGPALALMTLLVFAIVLTASRTGVIGVFLMALWGLIDRRLAAFTRRLLVAAPVMYLAGWLIMAAWSMATHSVFGGQQRLSEGDLSSSRFAIWSDSLRLIRDQPWGGVGFGEFNFAWSLSVLPTRPSAFFDHSHNLLLEFAVEFGLPIAGLLGLLLAGALWKSLRRSLDCVGDDSAAARCAVAMLVLIGVHSQLEYPLWYSYFLLPTAWLFGFALCSGSGSPRSRVPQDKSARWLSHFAGAILVASILAVADYARVVSIFSSNSEGQSLQARIANGQRSVLFAHHADYAAATVAEDPAREAVAFSVAAHYLLDTRLMTAWALSFAERGDLGRAGYLAQRLREFRNPQSSEFFAPCVAGEMQPPDRVPFQCAERRDSLGWRDFESP